MNVVERLRQRRLAALSGIRIASPCSADWEQMEGDEKVRFCHACRLNVYNLSAMDVEEAARLMSEKDGKLCVRLFRRADGTLITQDCPVGAERRARRRKAVGTVTALTTSVTAVLAFAAAPRHSMGVPSPSPSAAAHEAAFTGNLDALEARLKSGVDPNAATPDGTTLLMDAVLGGNPRAVEFLLEKGARTDVKNKEGRTALSYARELKLGKIKRLLAPSATKE